MPNSASSSSLWLAGRGGDAPLAPDEAEDGATYLVKTKLKGSREGLLVDPGAHDNLVGNLWVERMAELMKPYGHNIEFSTLKQALGVQGVGKDSQQCTTLAKVLIVFNTGALGTFTAPVVGSTSEPSNIPALLGLKSLEAKRAILDLIEGRLILCGPGSASIEAPPGSTILKLERAPSSHWLIPCSEFHKFLTSKNQGLSFPTDEDPSASE